MPTLTFTQEIHRPVADVFETVIDAGAFASWNPTIRSSRQITPGEIADSTTFEWDLRGFGTVRQHLDEFERNRRVRIVPEMKSLSGGHRFTFTDLGDRTRVDHDLEMTPRGVFRLMTPMIAGTGRKNLRATAEALKAHLESARSG
jgi:uncharacterized protein YndB with AHSA1/START domain